MLLQEGRPVVFVAKSLTTSQQNYSQIVFACNRPKYYICGTDPIRVETDYRSLLDLFQTNVGELTPRLANMRMELINYPIDMQLVFRPGKEIILVDTLSRSCPQEFGKGAQVEPNPMLQVCTVVIRSYEIRAKYQRATAEDEKLSVVI